MSFTGYTECGNGVLQVQKAAARSGVHKGLTIQFISTQCNA